MKNSLLIILVLSFSIFAQETIEEAYTKKAEKLVLKKDKHYIIPTLQGKSIFLNSALLRMGIQLEKLMIKEKSGVL